MVQILDEYLCICGKANPLLSKSFFQLFFSSKNILKQVFAIVVWQGIKWNLGWAIDINLLKPRTSTNPKFSLNLAFKPIEEGKSIRGLMPHPCKKALAEMIIMDELSFRFMEGLGFKRFMSVAPPRFHPIPCHTIITKAYSRVFWMRKKSWKKPLEISGFALPQIHGHQCKIWTTWISLCNL